jgi:thiosulfate/3-mercaptopyruvate sulfurtransferase
MMIPKNLATLEWLPNNLSHPNIVIIDCRFELGAGNSSKGREDYHAEHIPGALYFDLEKDLSGPKQKHGGRHPLPDLHLFTEKLSQAGIDESKKVVAYDDQGGTMAARLWWMLKYLGHDQVVILREGFSAWKAKGLPTSNDVVQPEPASFKVNIQPEMLIGVEDVKRKISDDKVVLIDARAQERYLGLQEDIDPVAGHIPGAKNEFWKEALGTDGAWITTEEQQVRLASYLKQQDKEVILYCGSGVTACANAVAFNEVGLKPKLYMGSWSDWVSYPENKIGKK